MRIPYGSRMFVVIALIGGLAAAPAQASLTVRVEGLAGPERDNVEARLGIRSYAESGGSDEAQIRRLHRQADGDIREALQAYGFYSPAIKSSLSANGGDWLAAYRIDAGPPTLLRSVQVSVTGEGRTFAPLEEALGKNPLHEGERLRHQNYDAIKNALGRAAYQNGFLDAKFTAHELRVDPLQRRADVTLTLDTGPRYYFGDVDVAQEGLDPEFVTRYVPIVPGAPFEPDKLLAAQFALTDLGYFDSVDVQPHRELEKDRHVPVTIATHPRPPHRYDFGLGYGTDTGARMTTGAEFRQLNRSGHKLRTDLRISEVKNSIGADYTIPLGTRAGDNLGFATTYTDEKIGDGYSRRYDFAITLARHPGAWQRQLYVKHSWEKSYVPATGVDTTKLLTPGVALSRGDLDDPINARKGWSVFLDTHGGYRGLIDDVSFIQGRAVLRGVWPLGERTRVLGRAEFGATRVGEFGVLPASQRFFAGGDQSVRGYAYQSLGPRDATGKVIGGKYVTTYSLETEYRVYGNWGAATFIDLGNAADNPAPRLFRGAGAGLRYRAPIGTLQVDFAHPFDGESAKGVRMHIGIRVGL